MESGGEVKRSVLRVGGWAGILAGIIFIIGTVVGFVIPALGRPIAFPPDLAQDLASFPENGTIVRAGISLVTLSLLLLLAFWAALYWSLREPSRVFARIGLGSGVLAVILLILNGQIVLQSGHFFSALFADPASDQDVVVATYAAVRSLAEAAFTTGFFFLGLAFVGFGLAMRSHPAYQEGMVWLTVVLGVLIVLLFMFILGLFSILLFVVLAVVLGRKVYSLAGAA